jgi:hypothetical protein
MSATDVLPRSTAACLRLADLSREDVGIARGQGAQKCPSGATAMEPETI